MSMRLSVFSRCFLLLFLGPMSLLGQIHLGDSHAQQQLDIAQQWLQAKRYSVAADLGSDLKEHPDKIIAQQAAQVQV